MNGWTGPIDEQKTRDEACQRSQLQVESILGLMRDQFAVGFLLTPVP